MKITGIHTAVVEANYDWTLVKVSTDQGVTGIGEAFFAPGLTHVIKECAALLVGENPLDVDRLCRKIKAAGAPSGTAGMIYHAVSGIEGALLDLTGKAYGVPIYQLLGGKYRDRVRIYADCHAGEGLESLSPLCLPRIPSWQAQASSSAGAQETGKLFLKYHGAADERDVPSPDAYAERARAMVEQGYMALKFDVDVPTGYSNDDYNRTLSNRELDVMVTYVRALREAVGDTVDIAIDCHWAYNVGDALRLAWACEPYRLAWLEDPTPPQNIKAVKAVTDGTRTPISTGENYYGLHGFLDLIKEQACRIAAPDLQKVGGLLEARRIADFADAYCIALAPHNISSPIGTVASAHLCAAIPNFIALEHHGAAVPFWEEMASGYDGPIIRDGCLALTDRPGLGIELNEDAAYKYRKPCEAFFD